MLEFPLNQLHTYYCIYFFRFTKWWFSWVKLRVALNIFLEKKPCFLGCTFRRHTSHILAGSYVAMDVCVRLQPRKYSGYKCVLKEAYRCVVLALQQSGCVIWRSNILRLLTFMMELWAKSAWNTCWTYEPLLLRNSRTPEPWCRNM